MILTITASAFGINYETINDDVEDLIDEIEDAEDISDIEVIEDFIEEDFEYYGVLIDDAFRVSIDGVRDDALREIVVKYLEDKIPKGNQRKSLVNSGPCLVYESYEFNSYSIELDDFDPSKLDFSFVEIETPKGDVIQILEDCLTYDDSDIEYVDGSSNGKIYIVDHEGEVYDP